MRFRLSLLIGFGAVLALLGWWTHPWGAPVERPVAQTSPEVAPRLGWQEEAQTMTRIREAVGPRPQEALTLLGAARQVDPNGPRGEERAALEIDALVNAGQIGRARDAAEEFLLRYPDGFLAEHVEVLTGVHPRPPEAP